MGGGSSVMGQIALRGTPDDYDEWAELGAAGWGWNEVLPYFRKLETDADFHGDLHGDSGPIPIRRTPRAQWPPLSRAVEQFARERQTPHIADMNGDFRDGIGSLPMSNTPMRRGSTAMSYLDASVRGRKNLTIMTGATVTGLLFDGRRVTGVSAMVDGASRDFHGAEVRALRRRHPFAGLSVARRDRPGGRAACARHRRRRRSARRGPQSAKSSAAVYRRAFAPRRAAAKVAAPASDQLLALFVRGCRRAPPSDMYIAAHSKTSWSALGQQIATFNATIFKPASRGRVTLASPELGAAGRASNSISSARKSICFA